MKPMLSPQFLSQLKRHRLNPSRISTGQHKGARTSTRHGSSLEFSDYQMYELGDDVRQIDWNVYARTEKVYVKRYLDEREVSISLYLDCTESMRTESVKWERATELTASLAYMILSSDDRLSLHLVGQQAVPLKKKGTRDAKGILHSMGNVQNDPGERDSRTPFMRSLKGRQRSKSSVTILITDALEPLSEIYEALKWLSSKKERVYFIQLLHEDEISQPYTGDWKLKDSERGEEIDVSFQHSVIDRYLETLHSHNEAIERECKRYGFTYRNLISSQPVNEMVLKDLKMSGMVR
ncbi:hypothetical protein ASG66_12895 [Bacillus sp. Leaf406]|nr:hypothetical protein ASG66_12895 [Bacillus sp. Leaf406]